jgi:hypothetical protein
MQLAGQCYLRVGHELALRSAENLDRTGVETEFSAKDDEKTHERTQHNCRETGGGHRGRRDHHESNNGAGQNVMQTSITKDVLIETRFGGAGVGRGLLSVWR